MSSCTTELSKNIFMNIDSNGSNGSTSLKRPPKELSTFISVVSLLSVYRDLKTSNILLDNNMKAKVLDFGLSKLAIDGISHVSSIVRGTVGYLDPEYYISNHLTEKSDIYSS
ncbi:hypothetical protein L1987_31365 [Smallanthus sonchifolius]|uniref:Uncharacterized protein n=1 Tax=Smallanthus sonchifolius TaxID=185202 RepID=A0ACB9I6X1_9ASTR|nr:hypothetical protein L1987_31365 [Smallanthus sonchifolius]